MAFFLSDHWQSWFSQIKALRNVVKMPEDNFNKPVSVTHQKMSWDFWYFVRKRPLAFKLCRMRNQYWIRTFFNANIFARDSLQQLRKISSISYIVQWPQHIPRLISCIRQLELGLVFKVLDTLKTETVISLFSRWLNCLRSCLRRQA